MSASGTSHPAGATTPCPAPRPCDLRKAYAGRKVLVTGGLGFIGSNLALELVALGADVLLLDSLIPEYGGNLFNIEAVRTRVRVNISDLRDRHSLPFLVTGQGCIFNLAGQTSHLDSMHDPFTDLAINCSAQLSLLETCRRHNPEVKIVFASTRQVYGRPRRLPVDEEHPVVPVDLNGIHKHAGESYHMLFHSVYGMRTVVLRLTNTIGPRMRVRDARQTFLGLWIRRAIERVPFEVWGGEQRRDFNDVRDVVDALLRAGADDTICGRAFNLGAAPPVRLREVAERLAAAQPGASFEVREFPAERKRIDIGDYYATHERFSSACGWAPVWPLEETLGATLAFYREHLHHYI